MTEAMWTTLGWLGTSIFITSFLVKDRGLLHLLGLIGCVVKLVYTWHYSLWPLMANWLVLICIESVQWWRYRSDSGKPSVDECVRCQQ